MVLATGQTEQADQRRLKRIPSLGTEGTAAPKAGAEVDLRPTKTRGGPDRGTRCDREKCRECTSRRYDARPGKLGSLIIVDSERQSKGPKYIVRIPDYYALEVNFVVRHDESRTNGALSARPNNQRGYTQSTGK